MSAYVGQHDLDQIVINAGACHLGWLSDSHSQLPLVHRRYQIAVLDRVGQLRIIRAAGLEIGADTQHDQRWRCLILSVPDAGSRAQCPNERPPLAFICTLGKHLLELINH